MKELTTRHGYLIDMDGVLVHERLLLRGERGFELRIAQAVHFDAEPSRRSRWTFRLAAAYAVLLAAGLATRVSAVLLWVCVVSLNHRNPVLLNSGDTFIRNVRVP